MDGIALGTHDGVQDEDVLGDIDQFKLDISLGISEGTEDGSILGADDKSIEGNKIGIVDGITLSTDDNVQYEDKLVDTV